MDILDTLSDPADIRLLDERELDQLAREVRTRIVDTVCRTGGHLGPNLGVVELTIALHRVFDSPQEPLVFDTGHQAYVHKLLTGRQRQFASLRQAGGLSGYPSRLESPHDLVENSHASTAIAYADGLSKAFEVAGERDRPVVVVIGDGALTGGLAWEALNNVGAGGRRVIVLLNDNGRSYSPTVGGLSRHLERLHDRDDYQSLVQLLGDGHGRWPPPVSLADGNQTHSERRATALSGHPYCANLFGAIGFAYLGPVDGHDRVAVEQALRRAREAGGPIVVHCRTTKGVGYPPAEHDDADCLHTVGVVNPATGQASAPSAPTWTDAFAEELVQIGARHRNVVAVSAAMLGPTGLQRFAERFPSRCFDVGIAEQQAVTSAAGLAMGGLHPVVAIYSTFANRAFDQILLDVALHRLPVTLVLDRAGITGPDGPSHHGMWDLAVFSAVPGLHVAAPRDAQSLAAELWEAVETRGPTAIRFPKAKLGPPAITVDHHDGLDLLRMPRRPDILLISIGAMATTALEAAERLAADGIECTVVDPRWVLPANPALARLAAAHPLAVTVEDGVLGGAGSKIADLLAASDVDTSVVQFGLPVSFIPHGSRAELLARYGLDGSGLAGGIRDAMQRRAPARRIPLRRSRFARQPHPALS